VVLITLVVVNCSVITLAENLQGWAVLEGKIEEGDDYLNERSSIISPEKGEILYLLETQVKNVSSSRLILNRTAIKLKDQEGYLHPGHIFLPPQETNFTVLEPGTVLWYTWAFSAPEGIKPKEILFGPGKLLNSMDLRVPVHENKPSELLKQTLKSTEVNKPIRVCNLSFFIEEYQITDRSLEVIFEIVNSKKKEVKLDILNCTFQAPFIIGKFGEINTEKSPYSWSDKKLPSVMYPGETVRVKGELSLEDLSPPYYLGIYVGASPRDLKNHFWKIP